MKGKSRKNSESEILKNEIIKKLVTKVEFKELADKVTKMDAKIDDKFAKIDDKFVKIDDKFDKLDKTIAKIGIELIKHSEQIGEMVTRKEFNEKMNLVLEGNDKIVGMFSKFDQERIFMDERLRRVEEKVFKE